MSELVDDFLKSLVPEQKKLDTAIALLRVCREYLDNHYKHSVFGSKQKTILDVLDEFLEEVDKE